MKRRVIFHSKQETLDFGAELARQLEPGMVVYLKGELGAGKTTLVRGVLRALGHEGKVKSPTYNLVESYELQDKLIHHFDLYRLNDPEELEFMGIRDFFANDAICFIEWPEKGKGVLPEASVVCDLSVADGGRELLVTSSLRGT